MVNQTNSFLNTGEVCLLGFSGSYLSLVFNSLRDSGYEKSIKIIKNIEVDDAVPFNCGFDYEILSSEEYNRGNKDRCLFSVSTPWIKEKLYNHFIELHRIERDQYFNLCHPSSTIGGTVSLGGGIYIEPGCVISPFAKIGFGSTINRNVSIGHHSQIGDFVTIQPGSHVAGHCKIGRLTQIGMGSVVFDRVEIGENSIIGGGSVVTKDVPSEVVAYGNPCKVIRKR